LNSVLSYIAGLVVLVLAVALIGPSFVDWNQFRGSIEAQAQRVTGRELRIGGDISFAVLPAPHLKMADVSLANVEGGSARDFARFDGIEAEVALAPLLRGEIGVTSIKITGLAVHLEVLADGRANWKNLFSGKARPGEGFFSPDSVSLERARFEDSSITYDDRRNGRSWRADRINGEVAATSLVGPLRGNFDFDLESLPFSVRFGLGNFGGRKAFPITAELQSRNEAAKLLFSGIATEFSANGRIDGTGSLEIGTTKAEGGQKPRPPVRVESGIVASTQGASFRNLTIAMAGTSLKGDARANWRDRPTASIRLAAEALTLDPLVDRLKDLPDGKGVPFTQLALLPVPAWIDATAEVKVGGLLAHDVLVRDAALAVAIKDGVLNLQRLDGDIGGGTAFHLDGTLAQDATGPRFAGRAEVSSRNLAVLAHWLAAIGSEPVAVSAPGDAQTNQNAAQKPAPGVADTRLRKPFAASSRVALNAERLDLTELAAAYAATPQPAALAGSLSFSTREARPFIAADIKAKSFDLDPLLALWSAVHPQKNIAGENAESAALPALPAGYDADIVLSAERLTLHGQTVSGLDVSAALKGDMLDLRRFEAGDLAGARVTLAGSLSGAAAGRLDALQGTLKGGLSTARLDTLLALAGIAAPGLAAPAELTLDLASGEAEDSQARLDTLTIKGNAGGSRVDAVFKRGRAQDGAVDRMDLIANAANGDGRVLLEQIGLSPRDGVPGIGTAALQMSGAAGAPYDTMVRISVGEGTFTAKGKLSDPLGTYSFGGRVDISASGIVPVMSALGVPEELAGFAAAQASGPSFVFSADAKLDPEAVAFDSLEAVAGNFHLSGGATYKRGLAGHLPWFAGKLEANAIDLAPLFAARDEANNGKWPVRALDWSMLGAFEGEAGLKAGAISAGTLRLEQADMRLALSGGALTVSPASAAFADGRASFGLRIEGGKTKEPGIGLTATVEGADIARAGARLFGVAQGTGRADLGIQLQGQGRSWLALVSSLAGTGTIKTKDAAFAPLDVAGFAAGIKSLKKLDDFAALEKETLLRGATPVQGLDGDFTVADGVVTLARPELEIKGGKAKLAAMFDLPRLAADSELTVTLAEPQGAPPFRIVAAGKTGAIARRTDTLALQQFVATEIIKESAAKAGLDFISRDLKKLMELPSRIPLPLSRPLVKEDGAAQ